MHNIYALKEMAIEELERFAENGELNRSDLPTIDLLAHTAKNLCKIIEMCEQETGYSYGNRFNIRGTYSNENRGGGNRGGYSSRMYPYSFDDRSYSMARRRDSMGRYSGDDDWMISTLEELKTKAPNDQMRMEFQEFIDRMQRMK